MRFASRGGGGGLIGVGVVAAGLVDAAGLLGHDVAGDGVGAGAGSSADIAEFAGAAFAVQLIGVAELHEDGRLLIDVGQGIVVQIAALDGQESAGVNLADMGDEDEAASIVDALVGKGVIAGVPASRLMPHDAAAKNLLIVAATETSTDEDCEIFAAKLAEALS